MGLKGLKYFYFLYFTILLKNNKYVNTLIIKIFKIRDSVFIYIYVLKNKVFCNDNSLHDLYINQEIINFLKKIFFLSMLGIIWIIYYP